MHVTLCIVGVSPNFKNFILKAFPPALALASHEPHFSIEMFESWVSSSGYELYDTWLKNSASISQDPARGQELVDDASTKDIKKFRETVRFIPYLDEIIIERFFPYRLQLLTMPKTNISLWKTFRSGFVPLLSKLGFYGSGRPPPIHCALPQRCQTILLCHFHGSYFARIYIS